MTISKKKLTLFFEKQTTQTSIINKIGRVIPNATLGDTTNKSIGIPMATAPPNPDFDIAVVKVAEKANT